MNANAKFSPCMGFYRALRPFRSRFILIIVECFRTVFLRRLVLDLHRVRASQNKVVTVEPYLSLPAAHKGETRTKQKRNHCTRYWKNEVKCIALYLCTLVQIKHVGCARYGNMECLGSGESAGNAANSLKPAPLEMEFHLKMQETCIRIVWACRFRGMR